ncbi:RNA-directed DNA polymerase (reverse transcriptase)-related family protein [Rhynchospora pubera]|uniref:RNA-directed DNA polymerase (Reverse transcriptase)-related family protein n=1 Tax=Rhynchospora pubera TaxID=906938 RepID=A0AAV8GM45_9POAL|nr:RNA-directed DNA polymerase (reverse transcriptase)-related family protein [Rhynchospora pubera]
MFICQRQVGMLLRRHQFPAVERAGRSLHSEHRNGWITIHHAHDSGRLVLLNSYLSSLPTYFMSTFKLPSWVIKKIDVLRRNFLWHGVNHSGKKMIMISWNVVTKPKSIGGLGVIDLKTFNMALLSKWIWKWNQTEPTLWKNLAASLQSNVLSLTPFNSRFTPLLTNVEHLVSVGLSFQVNNGKNTLFWMHNWLSGILKYKFPELFSFVIDPSISVSKFAAKLSNPFDLFSPLLHSSPIALSQLNALLQASGTTLLQLSEDTLDSLSWSLPGAAGNYSTKSVYHTIKVFPVHSSNLRKIWKLRIPPRFQIFLWQMMHNKIATLDNLQKRDWQLPNMCSLCNSDSETVTHLFNHCAFFKSLLASISISIPAIGYLLLTTQHHSSVLTGTMPSTNRDLLSISYFILWRERCNRIFKEVSKKSDELAQEVLLEWHAFKKTS